MKFREFFEQSECQQLDEVFDKPFYYEELTSTPGFHQYRFETNTFDDDDLPATYYVTLNGYQGEGELTFETDSGEKTLTGSGDAFRVFATVFDIVKKHKKEINSWDIFEFGSVSNEASRIKLYSRFAKMCLKILDFDEIIKYKKHRDVYFKLVKD